MHQVSHVHPGDWGLISAEGGGLHTALGSDDPLSAHPHPHHAGAVTPWQERWNMALLVLLYMMQGIPLGLTLGAM